MFKKSAAAAVVLFAGIATAQAQSPIEVTLQYPNPELFAGTHRRSPRNSPKCILRSRSLCALPAIPTKMERSAHCATPSPTRCRTSPSRALTASACSSDKNIPAPLDDYIAAERDFDKQGFHQAMYDIGSAHGRVYALPFAISLPVVYVNADLAKKAGADIDNLPITWDGLIDLAKRIKAVTPDATASPTSGT
ncbi:extracellular solute-binding protein [Bradyrhizobium sp. BR 1432]|uniref:extracellular solute-binding protein n=1 Tax=Bradyrhizobium sp. BR 1432 TaxID=3447966 RepID=UPI003EE6D9EA